MHFVAFHDVSWPKCLFLEAALDFLVLLNPREAAPHSRGELGLILRSCQTPPRPDSPSSCRRKSRSTWGGGPWYWTWTPLGDRKRREEPSEETLVHCHCQPVAPPGPDRA